MQRSLAQLTTVATDDTREPLDTWSQPVEDFSDGEQRFV